jgi:tellurite methyltransferase
MNGNTIGERIAAKRKELGFSQQKLAEALHISFQAVSKWETGSASPDIEFLPKLAEILETTTDALLGFQTRKTTIYEKRYQSEEYYWGFQPNYLCYEIMQRKPPVKPYRVLDIGCGEGKDAVFLARNGYLVDAFDLSETGVEKARKLAENCGVAVNFFQADMNDFQPKETYDIIFCSGVLHWLAQDKRKPFFEMLQNSAAEDSLHVMNVFVEKPFIQHAPDADESEFRQKWLSGELFTYYTDWHLPHIEEFVFDCNSGGTPHKHCMDVMIAKKP